MKTMKKLSKAAQALGRKGGKSKSPAKLLAVGRNLKKARAMRTKGYPMHVCVPCGEKHITDDPSLVMGKCGLCGFKGAVLTSESLGWPTFKVKP